MPCYFFSDASKRRRPRSRPAENRNDETRGAKASNFSFVPRRRVNERNLSLYFLFNPGVSFSFLPFSHRRASRGLSHSLATRFLSRRFSKTISNLPPPRAAFRRRSSRKISRSLYNSSFLSFFSFFFFVLFCFVFKSI